MERIMRIPETLSVRSLPGARHGPYLYECTLEVPGDLCTRLSASEVPVSTACQADAMPQAHPSGN